MRTILFLVLLIVSAVIWFSLPAFEERVDWTFADLRTYWLNNFLDIFVQGFWAFTCAAVVMCFVPAKKH